MLNTECICKNGFGWNLWLMFLITVGIDLLDPPFSLNLTNVLLIFKCYSAGTIWTSHINQYKLFVSFGHLVWFPPTKIPLNSSCFWFWGQFQFKIYILCNNKESLQQWRILRGIKADPPFPGFAADLFSLCNKFQYYNFIACVVIVSALLYNSYKWSNNHFVVIALAFIITQ